MSMTETSIPSSGSEAGVTVSEASVGDYLRLLKPRVMSLAVFTALAGMIAAPGAVHPIVAAVALILIAMGAGACGALNMWYDSDIDALMQRTAARPIPRGLVPREEALALGVILGAGSSAFLGLLVNWVAGGLLAFTIAYYVFIYTIWLKRRTEQNIVIGGAAGAFPPVIGWAVAAGEVSAQSLVLFLIIFLWTPPHFWALALYRVRDYQRARIPMMPVVSGPDATRRQILLYSLLLIPAGLLPAFTGLGGLLYAVTAAAAGAVFLLAAWRVFRRREGRAAELAAKQLFTFSIFYLFALFAALIAEHGFGLTR